MKKLILKLACGILKFINLFYRGLKLKDQVVIISRQSNQESMDIRMLREELEQLNIKVVTLCRKLSGLAYAFHMLKQMKMLNSSKVVVLDSYCILASVLPKRKGQNVVQMWHALGAIKKFGWQSAGSESGRSSIVAETMKMHAGYDYFLAPSAKTEQFFKEAFKTDAKAIRAGLPRIDYLTSKHLSVKEAIKDEYPQLFPEEGMTHITEENCKKNVLYVPTFRKNAALEMTELIEAFDFEKFNLIIKKHFLDEGDYSFACIKGAVVDEDFTSLEWFTAVDKVVTDYSAISLEAAVAEKELIIYQPDIREYERDNGLNMHFEEEAIAPYYAKDEEGLLNALKADYDMNLLMQFRKKYFEINLTDVTGQLAKFVASLM